MRSVRQAFLWLFVLMMGSGVALARELTFNDLEGWAGDDHASALAVWLESCDVNKSQQPRALCAAGREATDPRVFFETHFRPRLIGAPPALFTGYYEPELTGSAQRTPRFTWPVYAKPPEFNGRSKWHSRSEIETRGLLRGRGLELAWLENPVDAFFLQVQGSGRIRLTDGRVLRLGFAAKNNHPYHSVGKELVRRGHLPEHRVSAQAIRAWIGQDPASRVSILHHNPSFVFFRKLPDLSADKGPIGAMGISVSALRSIAVDPDHVPMGSPVWVEKDGKSPLRRLMVAQDVGTAIKGAQRADIFYGTGAKAGSEAGRIRDAGRMVVLLPRLSGG